MYLIPHHKTGSAVSWELFALLCCPGAIGKQNVFKYVSPCLEPCREKESIHLFWNGYFNIVKSIPTHHLIVHFIRHPVDVVISGYNYHKNCNEPSWTNSTTWTSQNLVQSSKLKNILNVSTGHTYCTSLQKVDTKTGIYAETVRTLTSTDGLTTMLNVHHFLQNKLNYYPLCMYDYMKTPEKVWTSFSRYADRTVPYEKFGYLLKRHANQHAVDRIQVLFAQQALRKFMTLNNTILNFGNEHSQWTCKSQYLDHISEALVL